jgi:hypothetical protein
MSLSRTHTKQYGLPSAVFIDMWKLCAHNLTDPLRDVGHIIIHIDIFMFIIRAAFVKLL